MSHSTQKERKIEKLPITTLTRKVDSNKGAHKKINNYVKSKKITLDYI